MRNRSNTENVKVEVNLESLNGETNTNSWQRIIFKLRRREKGRSVIGEMKTENCSMKWNEGTKRNRWAREKKKKKKNDGEKGENSKEKAREIRLAIEPLSEKRGFSKWWPSTITYGPFKCNSTLFDRAEPSRAEPSRIEPNRAEPNRTVNNVSTDCYRATIADVNQIKFREAWKKWIKEKTEIITAKSWNIELIKDIM